MDWSRWELAPHPTLRSIPSYSPSRTRRTLPPPRSEPSVATRPHRTTCSSRQLHSNPPEPCSCNDAIPTGFFVSRAPYRWSHSHTDRPGIDAGNVRIACYRAQRLHGLSPRAPERASPPRTELDAVTPHEQVSGREKSRRANGSAAPTNGVGRAPLGKWPLEAAYGVVPGAWIRSPSLASTSTGPTLFPATTMSIMRDYMALSTASADLS